MFPYWTFDYDLFSIKPLKSFVQVKASRVHTHAGSNVTLSCFVTGNPVPSLRYVLGSIVNLSSLTLEFKSAPHSEKGSRSRVRFSIQKRLDSVRGSGSRNVLRIQKCVSDPEESLVPIKATMLIKASDPEIFSNPEIGSYSETSADPTKGLDPEKGFGSRKKLEGRKWLRIYH